MKTIFVTVLEFLKKGGELSLGRTLFQNAPEHNIMGEFKGLHTLDGEMIIVQQSHKSFPMYSMLCFVEIECTPIYK